MVADLKLHADPACGLYGAQNGAHGPPPAREPTKELEMQDTTAKVMTVEVTVSFPLSKRGDYHHKAHVQETIGTLRAAAMEHFHAHEEAGSEYYLTNDKDNDARLPDSDTVGEVAGEADTLELTLVKELIQG
jgi:hypothetical protein